MKNKKLLKRIKRLERKYEVIREALGIAQIHIAVLQDDKLLKKRWKRILSHAGDWEDERPETMQELKDWFEAGQPNEELGNTGGESPQQADYVKPVGGTK
jgi:hypothetical protein